jgi:hypothetical protein
MADYQYNPVISQDSISQEEKEIVEALEPVRDTSASTSLVQLDAFENDINEKKAQEPYETYSEVPVKTIDKDSSIKYPANDNARLKELSNKENLRNITPTPSASRGFFSNLATVYMEIIDELTFVNSVEDLYLILSKDERLVAIGIFLICLSIFLMVFNKM